MPGNIQMTIREIRNHSKFGPFRLCLVIALLVPLLILTEPIRVAAAELDTETRIHLQVSLKSYIDNKTENDSFPFFNAELGKTEKLILKNLHPKIFRKEDYYLMCADFLNKDGEEVLIDFVVRKHNDGFRVEQEIRGRRTYLTQIFERIF